MDYEDRFGLNREQQVVVRNAVLALVHRRASAGEPPVDPGMLATKELLANHGVEFAVLRLDDAAHLIDVLADKMELSDKELKQWLSLLHLLDRRAVLRTRDAALEDHAHERACRATIVQEAQELPILDRLLEIEAMNRRGIRENIELLMRLQRERRAAA